jgi:hypothetical protein
LRAGGTDAVSVQARQSLLALPQSKLSDLRFMQFEL